MDKSDYQKFNPETKFCLDFPCPTPILEKGGAQSEIPSSHQEDYQGAGYTTVQNTESTTYIMQEK